MENNLLIIVPYRNREEHLDIFINEINKFIKNINYSILIVEQNIGKPFNRGKLLNVGFNFLKNNFDYFCFHDVDMIPIDSDYSYPQIPTHIATAVEQFDYKMPYKEYFGGVTLFNKIDFIKINGFNNNYWGWGAENDDIILRVKKNNLKINRRYGEYKSLLHQRNNNNHPDYENNVNELNLLINNKKSYLENGLNNLEYEIIEDVNNKNYRKIIVNI